MIKPRQASEVVPWSLEGSPKAILVGLVLLYALIFFPFRFTTGMQDLDSYRMLLGMLDDAARGTHFSSPMLYNREVSFGYYALIFGLISPFGHAPGTIVAAMNGVSLIAAVFFAIPFYLVVERLFDRRVAVSASIILPVVPVWWDGALYGHPSMPGVLLFFCALAIVARHGAPGTPVAIRSFVLCLVAAALSFRFDLVLLFPALAAVIFYRYPQTRQCLKETAFYVVGSLALFKLGQLALPTIPSGPGAESILVLLHRYQDPSRLSSLMQDLIVKPLVKMGGAFSPFLLILILPACWIFLRRENIAQFLFTAGVIVLNVVFWLPNPDPVRHYLPMSPAASTAAAATGLWLVSKVGRPQLRRMLTWSCGPVVGLTCVTVSIGLHYGPGRLAKFESPFWFRFTLDEHRSQASQIAADLVTLQGPKEPILVLCDANYVAARMQMLADGVTVRPHPYPLKTRTGPFLFYEVNYAGRTFMMLEQSFYPDLVESAINRMNLYPSYPVLVDPYNSDIVYRGGRLRAHLERTTTGERVRVDSEANRYVRY